MKFLETIWFLIRILMHTETNINFMLISKVTAVSKVMETIYILGLGVPGLRPPSALSKLAASSPGLYPGATAPSSACAGSGTTATGSVASAESERVVASESA